LYIAVVGPGEGASDEAVGDAAAVAKLVAERGWITLCGGRDAGVMAAAARGAAEAGGISVGILPDSDRSRAASELTIALPTGLGEARNAVLVSCADAVVSCGMNPGTLSELAFALRARKPTVLVRASAEDTAFLAALSRDAPVFAAATPREAVAWLETLA
jgi:uncharacterized protein (TIGR00725 family)